MTRRAVLAVGAAAFFSMPIASALAQQAPLTETPADRPLITERPIPEPRLAIEGGAGILGFVAGPASLGPAWNVRVTGNLTNRWAVEGNYVGAYNNRIDGDGGMMMAGFDASARYNILRGDEAFVQPYVTAGLGFAAFAGQDGDLGTLTLPVSIGAERMVTSSIKAGARATFRPAFFDHLGPPTQPLAEQPGADTWSLIAHVGGAF